MEKPNPKDTAGSFLDGAAAAAAETRRQNEALAEQNKKNAQASIKRMQDSIDSLKRLLDEAGEGVDRTAIQDKITHLKQMQAMKEAMANPAMTITGR